MVKLQLSNLQPQTKEAVLNALVYEGKITAIKLYMQHVKCRVADARTAVDRLSQEIEPGQASC
ncbi:MAG: hypothetical protein AAF399_16905 [Bacteroidota bacterium]